MATPADAPYKLAQRAAEKLARRRTLIFSNESIVFRNGQQFRARGKTAVAIREGGLIMKKSGRRRALGYREAR